MIFCIRNWKNWKGEVDEIVKGLRNENSITQQTNQVLSPDHLLCPLEFFCCAKRYIRIT